MGKKSCGLLCVKHDAFRLTPARKPKIGIVNATDMPTMFTKWFYTIRTDEIWHRNGMKQWRPRFTFLSMMISWFCNSANCNFAARHFQLLSEVPTVHSALSKSSIVANCLLFKLSANSESFMWMYTTLELHKKCSNSSWHRSTKVRTRTRRECTRIEKLFMWSRIMSLLQRKLQQDFENIIFAECKTYALIIFILFASFTLSFSLSTYRDCQMSHGYSRNVGNCTCSTILRNTKLMSLFLQKHQNIIYEWWMKMPLNEMRSLPTWTEWLKTMPDYTRFFSSSRQQNFNAVFLIIVIFSGGIHDV